MHARTFTADKGRSVAGRRHLAAACSALVAVLAIALGCSEEAVGPPLGEATGSIRVLVQTSAASPGAQLDPDGYMVTLHGLAPQAIAPNGTVTFPDVAIGDHIVEVGGLQANCTTQRTAFSATVVANQAADVTFPITCWPPTTGRIAFTTNIGGPWEIYSVNPDGTDLRQVTHTDWADHFPAWSPDGWKIAFSRVGIKQGSIYVTSFDGTGLAGVTDNKSLDVAPAWSPDGTKIAFKSNRDPGDNIYVVNVDGTGMRQVAGGYMPSWSPDGSKLIYSCGEDVCAVNVDGTGEVNLTNSPAWDWTMGRACSPDGSKIAFTSDRDGNWEIYVMNVDGSNPVNVTNSVANEETAAWSPDGTKILYTKKGNVYYMNADGTAIVNVTGALGGTAAMYPDWSHGTGALGVPALTQPQTPLAARVPPSRDGITEER